MTAMRAPPLARSASLGFGDLEAPCGDACSQIAHRRPAEDVVGHAVGDVQAHEQPRPLGLLPCQAHEVPVRDADRLGGILDARLRLASMRRRCSASVS